MPITLAPGRTFAISLAASSVFPSLRPMMQALAPRRTRALVCMLQMVPAPPVTNTTRSSASETSAGRSPRGMWEAQLKRPSRQTGLRYCDSGTDMVAAGSTTAGDIFGAIGEGQHSQSFCARPAVATLYSGVGDALAVRGVKNLESLGMVPGAAVMRNRTRGSACLGPRSYGGQQWVGLGPLLPQTRAAADGTAFAEGLAPCEQPNGVASAARLVPFTSSHSHQVGGRAGPSFRHRRRGHRPPSARSLQRVPGLRTHLPQGPGANHRSMDASGLQGHEAPPRLQGCKAARLQALSMLCKFLVRTSEQVIT